jgi:DNA-binding MarR family transcriptional regulator
VERTVHRIDDALVRLRRIWSAQPGKVVLDGARPVEMSGVLVVEACGRGAEAGREVSVGDVATFADVEHSTASRLVDRAVRGGLVERARSARDPRRTALTLTGAGRELRDEAVRFRVRWLHRMLDGWDTGDVDAFAGYLDRFAASVTEHGGPRPRV